MIRDRGNIKWAGLMLPEHNVELRRWKDKEHYIERPELNEWDLQSIQYEIEVAYKRKCQTLVSTWNDGKIMTRGGIIVGIDLRTTVVMLDNPFGAEKISVSNIIGVQIIE